MKKKVIYILSVSITVLIVGNIIINLNSSKNIGSSLSSTFLGISNEITDSSIGFFNNITSQFSYDEIAAENKEMEAELAMIQLENEDLIEENNQLRSENSLNEYKEYNLINAEIIQKNFAGSEKSVTINVGSDNGNIEVGNPVLFGNSLWGIVSSVYPNTTKVNIYADENANIYIPCRTQDDKSINGEITEFDYNTGSFIFSPLEAEDSIEVGTKIVTGEYSSSIPSGILIGEITSVEGEGSNIHYYLDPTENPYNAEFLTVVTK